ncbi:MAG TPA: sugar-binding protein, partial [Ardenticatenaceae bacterium]
AQPIVAAEPSQTQPVAAAEPSATQPVIVVEASVTQPVAAEEPSATQPLPTLPVTASPTPPPTPEPPTAEPTTPPTAEPTATIPPPTPEPTATSAPILLPEGPNGPNAFAGLRDRDRRINVDGTLNDWDGITPVSVTSLVFEEQGTEPYTGLTDLSGQARLAWDEQNLYLAIDRTDDVFVQNTESYELYLGDSIELWIDTDLYGDQNVAEANGDDFHLAFSPGDFDRRRAEGVVYDPGAREQGRNEQLRVRAFPTSGAGYQLEVSIPWRVLGVEPREGLELGYAVALNDNDNPSISQQQTQVSTTRQVPFNRPQTFGTLILVP